MVKTGNGQFVSQQVVRLLKRQAQESFLGDSGVLVEKVVKSCSEILFYPRFGIILPSVWNHFVLGLESFRPRFRALGGRRNP